MLKNRDVLKRRYKYMPPDLEGAWSRENIIVHTIYIYKLPELCHLNYGVFLSSI